VVIYTLLGDGVAINITDATGNTIVRLPTATYTVEAYFIGDYWLTPTKTNATAQITVSQSTLTQVVLTDYPPAIWTTTGFFASNDSNNHSRRCSSAHPSKTTPIQLASRLSMPRSEYTTSCEEKSANIAVLKIFSSISQRKDSLTASYLFTISQDISWTENPVKRILLPQLLQ